MPNYDYTPHSKARRQPEVSQSEPASNPRPERKPRWLQAIIGFVFAGIGVVCIIIGSVVFGKYLPDNGGDNGELSAVSISTTVVDTLTPTSTVEPEPSRTPKPTSTPTPHYRLTEIQRDMLEAGSELELAQLQAKSLRLVAIAESTAVSQVALANEQAANRELAPTQTAVALVQTVSAWTPTATPVPPTKTPQATLTQMALDMMVVSIQREQRAQANETAWLVGKFVMTAVFMLVGWIVIDVGNKAFRRREDALREPIKIEWGDYEPQNEEHPDIGGTTFWAIVKRHNANPDASPSAIAEQVFPGLNSRPNQVYVDKVRVVLDYIDHSPTTVSYTDFVATTLGNVAKSQ